MRRIASAWKADGAVAAKSGIRRESLYRSLSPKGNPTLKTLVAVLNTMGLSLSAVPQSKKARKRAAKKPAKTAPRPERKSASRALRNCRAEAQSYRELFTGWN